MKKKIIFFIIIIISVNLLVGCWSKKELSDIAITSAIGIDKMEDEYLVTAQIINPSEVAGNKPSDRSEVSTYRTTGKTIFEALRKLTHSAPRKIYLGHMMILMIGEELAKEGIGEILDFFSRDSEVRTDFYMVIAKDSKATDLLNILTPLERIPGHKIHYALETAEKSWASIKTVQLDELISILVSDGKEAVITSISSTGNPESANTSDNVKEVDASNIIIVDKIAVLNGDKVVGWLNQDESHGYNAIIGNIKNSVITIPCEKEGNLAVEILRTKSSIKSKIEDGTPKINIKFEMEANIADVECDTDITSLEEIRKIEKTLENEMKKHIKSSIEKAQSLESDVFGFGLDIYRKHPKEFKKLKDNWDEEFKNIDVNIDVKAEIKGTGTIKDTFIEEIDRGEKTDEN